MRCASTRLGLPARCAAGGAPIEAVGRFVPRLRRAVCCCCCCSVLLRLSAGALRTPRGGCACRGGTVAAATATATPTAATTFLLLLMLLLLLLLLPCVVRRPLGESARKAGPRRSSSRLRPPRALPPRATRGSERASLFACARACVRRGPFHARPGPSETKLQDLMTKPTIALLKPSPLFTNSTC
eukprot:scaffold6318_cov286-Prasinococcus_capsulatus_cf.AAC.1